MSKSRIISIGAAVVVVIGIVVWMLNRDKNESTGSTQINSPAANPARADDGGLPVMVVQIIERNTDTFASPLFEWTPERLEAPFSIDEQGTVHLLGSIANETDAANLLAHRLVLGTAGVPLAKCGALVIYSTAYVGKGRAADVQRFYAYEKFPAAIDIPAGFGGDKLEYDLEKSKQAFPVAVMEVRLIPKDPAVKVSAVGNDKITVMCAGAMKTLAAGEAAPFGENSRAIAVTELAVKSEPIGAGGGAAVEFLPRVEHGSIQFGTVLSVQYLGNFRAASKMLEAEGDLP